MLSSTMESMPTTSTSGETETEPLSLAKDPPNRLFHVAVGENNAGVDFYNKGDFQSSIRALHRSLDCMERFSKHHLEQQKQHGRQPERFHETRFTNDTPTPLHGNCCSPRSSPSLPLVQDDNHALRVSKTKPTSNTTSTCAATIRVNLNAMYSCALCLSCHGDCWEALATPLRSCSGSDLARIKASIFFNLGLAHHRQAGTIMDASTNTNTDVGSSLSSSSSSATRVTTLLEQAILLYKLSLGIQESEHAPISPENIMALCNNIGQCHVSLLRHHEARRWNERLLRLLICHGQKKATSTTTNSIHNSSTTNNHSHHYRHLHKCECFFQNTLSLILQDPCLSPAA